MSTIKEEIIKILDKQNKKGMDTYGQTLDDCPDDAYDWQQMMIEELVDALQYQIKENKRIRNVMDTFMKSLQEIAERRKDELESENPDVTKDGSVIGYRES